MEYSHQLINTVSTGYERDFERKADDGKLKINSYSPYYEEDGYLLDTADYFLTDEEKEMKFVMKVTDNEYSSYGTSDKTSYLVILILMQNIWKKL